MNGDARLELKNMPLHAGFQTGSPEDTRVPMIVTSDRIEVNETDGIMDFYGETHGEQGTRNYQAGELQILFDPRTRQLTRMTAGDGITLSDGDQIVTGGKFQYDAATGNAEIWENPMMWKGDDQLRATRFIMNDTDRKLRMVDSVEVVMTVPEDQALKDAASGGSDNRRIHLTAGNGIWDDPNSVMEFQDDVRMHYGLWKIRSDSMRMELDPETGDLSAADALGAVEINHESFDATGHSLTYNPENSILILRGTSDQKCQVKQGERGSQGDEIRFIVNENRFVITKGMSMIMPGEMTGSIR
ncbi:MAG TPA: LptA/OstA family protein [bacterium]|nr:LptA/OstA family protein [bacterium]